MDKFNGEKFKKIRLEKGFTQEEVSEMTKEGLVFVSEKTISHWENCPTSNPRQKNLKAVTKVLGINIEELFTREEETENNSREDSTNKKQIYLSDVELINEVVKLVLDPSYHDKKWILKSIRKLLVEHLY